MLKQPSFFPRSPKNRINVGPPLSDVRVKPLEGLLSDILDSSLMPLGLEAGITKEQMSDLLAFLLGK